MRERFIKVDGNVYYESELNMMSNGQLNSLIKECEKNIEEIDRKSNDYKLNNYDLSNLDHYQEVMAKFESASIYLQADIVLIDKILKQRKNAAHVEDDTSELDYNWCKEFVKLAKNNLLKGKWQKLYNKTCEMTGYKYNIEI